MNKQFFKLLECPKPLLAREVSVSVSGHCFSICCLSICLAALGVSGSRLIFWGTLGL